MWNKVSRCVCQFYILYLDHVLDLYEAHKDEVPKDTTSKKRRPRIERTDSFNVKAKGWQAKYKLYI